MAFHGKKYKQAASKVDRETLYTIEGAIRFLKDNPTTKFDATAEVAFRLGVDPTKSDQAVRGTVTLPHGTGKTVRVLVFANGPAADAAVTPPRNSCSATDRPQLSAARGHEVNRSSGAL